MVDINAMSTFEKYVQGLSLVPPDQLASAKKLQSGLRELGVVKGLEELLLRLGVLTPDRLSSILADIKKAWGISVPRPVIEEWTDEGDRQLQEKLVQHSPDSASQILECREIREKARALGLELKVSEILVAKGYYVAAVPDEGPVSTGSPVTATDSKAPAPEEPPSTGLSMDELLKMLPDVPPESTAAGSARKPALSRKPGAPPPVRPGAAKPAPPKPGVGRPGRPEGGEGEVEAKPAANLAKRNKLTFWIGIGAAAAIFLVAIIMLVVTSSSEPPRKEPEAVAAKPVPKPKVVAVKPEAKPAAADPAPVSKPDDSFQVPEHTKAPKPPETAPAPNAVPVAVQTAVATWKFDENEGETAADLTGHGHLGRLKGRVSWVEGVSDSGVLFDGQTGFIACDAAGLPATNAPQTIGLWYSVTSIPRDVQVIVGLTSDTDHAGVLLGFRDAKLSAWDFGGTVLVSVDPPAPNSWHHLAYTYDGLTHRLFLDGGSVSSSALPALAGTPTRLEFGRWEGGTARQYFKGMLDEVRLCSKALSAEDLKVLVPGEWVAKSAPVVRSAPDPATAPEPTPDPVAKGGPEKPAPDAKPAPPAPKPGPDAKPGPPPKAPAGGDPARQAREARAQELWELADKLEKDGKFAEAQDKLREVRSRYRSTVFYFDKMIEITDRINDLGQKIAAAALVKTSYYKRPHMDAWWSFEFVPPEGWKGVPSQPNMVGDQDNDESFYKGRTYQIARYNSPYLDKLYIVILKTFACTGLDNLESKVMGELELRFKGLKEDSKASGTGKAPYLKKTYVSNDGDRIAAYFYYADKKGIALVGVWRAGGDGLYVSIITLGPDGKRTTRKTSDHPVSDSDFAGAVKVFDQCAKTFWIYDAGARAGKRVDLGIGGSLCSDWSSLKSSKGNYIIEYATRQDFAKRAGEEMEQIQALYKHLIPSAKPVPPCRIKIFDREEDFKDYSNAIGAAAYWSPMQEEIVAYRFEGDKVTLDSKEEFTLAEERNPEDVTFKVLYHEGFHQYMHFFMGRARNIYVPSWLNEGMGDYFFGGDWNKGRSKFTIGTNDWRIKKIVTAVKKNEHVPLERIFKYEQMQYYQNASLCYAEGWAINYFFQMSDVAKKKGYNTIPQRMMEELKTSGNWEKATDKVFGGMDLKKMEEEWKEFILGLPIPKTAKGADEDDMNK